jgi:pyridinium-3,5-bisthiocarboxylic acid mononucleotide nickel chelatase
MRIAYLDIMSGISGDMMLAACIDAGVPFAHLEEELKKLPLHDYSITMQRVQRNMISAAKVDVHVVQHPEGSEKTTVKREAQQQDDEYPRAAGAHDEHMHGHHTHSHHTHGDHTHGDHTHGDHTHGDHTHGDHTHGDHTHGDHTHDSHSNAGHEGPHMHTRSWADIERLIRESDLSAAVRKRAHEVFLTLARAEARIHDTTIEAVHFHEVGATDSIVDIVGIAICLEKLAVERVYTSTVRTGTGALIRTRHGIMSTPAPATLELLKHYPIEFTDVKEELVTPTGAAVIAALSSGVLDMNRPLSVEAIGYGAGSKQFPELPNVLRLLVAEVDEEVWGESVVVLETTIDDMNTELYPWVIERLLSAGALDAWVQSVLMKKGRPGFVLTALVPESKLHPLIALLHAETTTSGVRFHSVRRHILARSSGRITTRFGEVQVKIIGEGEDARRVPEFEECRRIAQERNLPLFQVYRSIEQDCDQS